jgi:hypothetical protein
MLPGTNGTWPLIAGKEGPIDLSKPQSPLASLAYLHDFDEAWIAVRRRDNAIAVALSWEAKRFPCAWLWCELGGTAEAPWHGRGNLIGIEPNTTRPGLGIEKAKASGGTLLRLHPGEELSAILRFHVFTPPGPVTAVDSTGRARLTA